MHMEDIDVACIQETYLSTNHTFTIRGYQTFRLDREGRNKGGVLKLVWNSSVASNFKVNTNQQAKIHGVNIKAAENSAISILNLYCPPPPPPPEKDLSLQYINVPSQNCLERLLDCWSHLTSWGYGETSCRGDEEDWQTDNNMLLLNDPEDHQLSSHEIGSRHVLQTWTLQLKTCLEKNSRKVVSQLTSSNHTPVLLAINLQYRPSNPKTFPRWNYKKADWEMFSRLTNEYCKTVKADHFNINKATDSFN